MADAIEARINELEKDIEQLKLLKAAGVKTGADALKVAVNRVSEHLAAAKSISEAFGLDFDLPMDHRSLTYYSSRKKFAGDDYDSWSSSSLDC
jgi:hypothetical protein